MAPITVGSLVYEYQAIDVIGITDVLSSGSKLLAQVLKPYGPVDDSVVEKAPEFVYYHIGLTTDPVTLTGGVSITPNCTIDNAPEIDILVLGGPDPEHFNLDPVYAEYIRRHVAAGKTMFTNCTGAFVAAAAGALNHRNATVNHAEYEWVKKRYPAVKWTMETKWVVDGNIWTAAGAVTGMDMAAHWLKENYGMEILLLASMNIDFEPRDVHGTGYAIPKRFDASGKQIPTHEFKYYDSY